MLIFWSNSMLIFRSTCLMLVAIAAALGQPHSVPFQILGHIQSFKLDADCATNVLCGATMRVNGIDITIPKNTIIFFPATLLTPSDVFRFKADIFGRTGANPMAKPTDPILPASGLALDDPDNFKPLAAFEADVVGNILTRGSLPSPVPADLPIGTKPEYIAGLVHISQQSLNISDGYIVAINGARGEMVVGPQGALPGDPAAMRIKINDPIPIQLPGDPFIDPAAAANRGRYSVGGSPDARFTSDQENATIRSSTGFPMCIPGGVTGSCPDGNRPSCTANPAISIPPGSDGLALDPLCMEGRPGSGPVRRQRFTMGATDIMLGLSGPGVFPAPPCPSPTCNATRQAPFVVGDRITFAGTLAQDEIGKYISAHTITAWVAIYSKSTVYASIEVSLLGTGGIPFRGVSQETGPGKILPGATGTTRVKLEVITTDPSRSLRVLALDYSLVAGGPVQRSLTDPAGGAPKIRRPGAGTVNAGGITMTPLLTPIARPPFGRMRLVVDSLNFLPPPRELRVQVVGSTPTRSGANGIMAGQYSAPVGEFLFPENLVFGQRPVPANFENLCFLVTGSGPLTTMGRTTGPPVGPLVPWPSSGHAPGQVTCPP